MHKLTNIVRTNILSLKPYSSARDEFSGTTGVFLDANENPYGELNRYPDPCQKALKQKLAVLKDVGNENIFIGNGSDEIIDLTFRIFCNPGKDRALTFSPTYGMYEVSAAINNVILIKVPLKKDFQIDIKQTDHSLTDSSLKLIIICSPNNPTGNLINKKEIDYVLNKFNGIVLIDEAYIDFSSSESYITMLKQYSNLIVSQTFSKAWGLAAARVGVAYANQEIIQFFNKVKPPYNVSDLNQKAALNALHNYSGFKTNLKIILKEKKKLESELIKLKQVIKIYPSAANFLLVEVIEANKVYQELVNKNIITRNRNNIISNCLRISIGTPKENRMLLNALKTLTI
ncbi:MAG: histidinol-phosphate transaminase [Bacteroidales bacterium]|nr:histidinol-phosphate transaminase [Bacteroidales bacterium]